MIRYTPFLPLLMDVFPVHLKKLYALEHFLHEAFRKYRYEPFYSPGGMDGMTLNHPLLLCLRTTCP